MGLGAPLTSLPSVQAVRAAPQNSTPADVDRRLPASFEHTAGTTESRADDYAVPAQTSGLELSALRALPGVQLQRTAVQTTPAIGIAATTSMSPTVGQRLGPHAHVPAPEAATVQRSAEGNGVSSTERPGRPDAEPQAAPAPRRSRLGEPVIPDAPIQPAHDDVQLMPLQRMFEPATAAVAAGVASADGPNSVVFDPPPGSPAPVQRDGEDSADVGVPAAVSDPAPVAAAPATAASAPSAAAPPDLDDLARRLFEPLSARLKTELWLDRERAGHLTDVRR